MDREKIIRLIEEEISVCESVNQCYRTIDLPVLRDILSMLKEQEAVKPIYIENPYTHLPVSYCPKCKEPIDQYIIGNPYRKTKYCNYCGQAVTWE